MRFDVLGPVRVRHGTAEVPVPGLLRQRLLALLLAHANTPVSAGWLSTALWGGEPERRGSKLHLLVHRLRRTLGEPERLVSDAGSYSLQVGPDELDVERFETLLDLAERNLDPQRRVEVLRQALRLWRGSPFQDLDLAELVGEAQRVEERRLVALEQLHAAELDCGRHSFIIADLSELVRENPLRERLHALLMTALYRAGRQADALAVYRRARRTVVDELGLEPGPALRALERRILSGEHIEFESPTARLATRPAQLPHDVPGFVGREAALAELDRLSEKTDVPLAVVAGTAGVGKSALVTHWAHEARNRFPDGQLYVDLRGYGPDEPLTTTDVLAGFLRALGVPGDAIPADATERAARFRTVVDQRRLLIVLDNAAAADQVRPLLPGTPTSFVVVTSRDSLPGLSARDGACRLVLDRMDAAEAHALLTDRLGDQGVSAETSRPLIERCARLPLALRVAAERLHQSKTRDVGELLEELTDEHRSLDALETGDEHTSVRAVFSWSYRNLSDDAARLFRLCGFTCRHAGHRVGTYALTALLGADDVQTTQRLLDVLVRAHLITEVGHSRYEMHALLGDYAAELAEQERNQPAVVDRLLGFYLHTADQAMRLLQPSRQPEAGGLPRPVAMPRLTSEAAAVRWLEIERPNLMCVAETAAKAGMDDLVGVVCRLLHGYLAADDRYYDDAERLATLASGAALSDH
ncbi:AfsR/SARP family transcriptional regulator [Saccharopolyspora rhizosphaerae]|uniref:AfsR/SARP family transcriptional regulator n=1 Tax=Saccharopolyspora rhizosphaerae TaxID=2492662 RepID=UPI0013157666|nr:BTAD domain-containing putative transcriptional regulator [Saccharopolyspora rhizosphaerae]